MHVSIRKLEPLKPGEYSSHPARTKITVFLTGDDFYKMAHRGCRLQNENDEEVEVGVILTTQEDIDFAKEKKRI
jgi:hypothetical protein